MISGDVTVARLLDEHPDLIEVLARYHPHFTRLRNRLLRRLMAPRVTVIQAARMAGVPADELLAVLRRAVEGPALAAPDPTLSPERRGSEALESPCPFQGEGRGKGGTPSALANISEDRRVDLDVREDIHRGAEPFARIMAAVKALAGEQVLVLRVPFEPIPLYDVLGKRGFAHWTERRTSDDWSVWFYRDAALCAEPIDAAPLLAPGRRIVLDVRGLEPPQPLLRVLQEMDRLGVGSKLEVLHDRWPVLLYPRLDERGFVHETDEPEPGLVRILIRRGPA